MTYKLSIRDVRILYGIAMRSIEIKARPLLLLRIVNLLRLLVASLLLPLPGMAMASPFPSPSLPGMAMAGCAPPRSSRAAAIVATRTRLIGHGDSLSNYKLLQQENTVQSRAGIAKMMQGSWTWHSQDRSWLA